MKSGIERIASERQRQKLQEAFDNEHDAKWVNGELSKAACCYAYPNYNNDIDIQSNLRWPFDEIYYKPNPYDRVKDLAKAGALIAAEIDRLQFQKEIELKKQAIDITISDVKFNNNIQIRIVYKYDGSEFVDYLNHEDVIQIKNHMQYLLDKLEK